MSAPTSLRQTVVVTAVPRGYQDSSTVRLGAVVSPRLSYANGPAVLGDFPDWAEWYLQRPDWQVSFSGSAGWLPATSESAQADGALYGDVFPADTDVASFTGSPGPARTAFGYSYATLADAVREAYEADDLIESQLGGAASRGLPPARPGKAPTDSVIGALGQYLGFWQPVGDLAPDRGYLRPEFHERLSLLNDHPGLLEALGLVVNLLVPVPRAGIGTTVRVRPVWSSPSGTTSKLVTPDTRLNPEPGRFAPALRTADGRHDDRLHLALDQGQTYSVHSLDVDASVAQLVSVVRGRHSSTTEPPSVPSARGGGLTLAMSGRMQLLQDRLTQGRKTASGAITSPGSPPALYAEDLIVGHHVQVGLGPEDATPDEVRWYGLGHRHTSYRTDNSGLEVTDEAPVTLLARRQDPADPTKLLVSDVVVRWDGWSLAVPHPGRRQLLQDDPTVPGSADGEGRPGLSSLTFTTTLPVESVDGSDPRLPPLRYGALYRFRGRAVDLIGHAPEWDGAPATRPVTYFRWEAAASPLVLPPELLTRTEDALRMVVRSNPRAGQAPSGRSGRTIVPPRVSVDVALKHGVVDRSDGVPRADAWNLVATLDDVTPPDRTPRMVGGFPQAFRVDWLPDPMTTDVLLDVEHLEAREASFVPGTDPSPLGVASLSRWYGVQLSLLGLLKGSTSELGQVEDLPDGRRVRVGLRPAARGRIAVRSMPRPERAAQHGVVDWLPGDLDAALDRLRRAGVPAVNPDRYVEVVHAVKKPLYDPQLVKATATRLAGQQNPSIDLGVALDDESSGRVTVVASWSEWQDAGARLRHDGWSAPERIDVARTALLDQDLAPVDTPAAPPLDRARYAFTEQLVLPDLRRRDVRLTVSATSRFVEEFRTTLAIGFKRFPATGGPLYLDRPTDVDLESIQLTLAGRRLAPGTDYEIVDNPLNGRRTLRLTGTFGGSSPVLPTVEGVKGPVIAAGLPVPLTIPSAVRAAPPQLVHALPAWVSRDGAYESDGSVRASRGAGRLRLWLERPWWTSGDGEQLAVITSHDHQDGAEFADDTSPLSKVVSVYGLDPALTVTSATPRVTPVSTGTVVSEVEIAQELGAAGPVLATIAAHDVTYHAGRDLYVSEVGFPDKPAGTFVRLAVARYQSAVAPGVPQLSRVVTLDPVQLLARRTLLIRNQTDQGVTKLRVSVTGPVHKGDDQAHRPQLRVSVQRHLRPEAGAELGWDTISSTTVDWQANGYPVTLVTRPGEAVGDDYRILVEEIEYWSTPGNVANPQYQLKPTSAASAVDDLLGERVTWVATTPMPTN